MLIPDGVQICYLLGNALLIGNILKYILLVVRESLLGNASFLCREEGELFKVVEGVEKVCLTVSTGIWDILEHSHCS